MRKNTCQVKGSRAQQEGGKKNEWKTRRRRDRRDRRRTLKSNGRKRAGRKLDWKEPDELKEEE